FHVTGVQTCALPILSFRYLDPENYKRIAGWLAAKRADREQYIEEVIKILHAELDKAGIKAEVAGRPKHIFSIWRKMQRKGLSFEIGRATCWERVKRW